MSKTAVPFNLAAKSVTKSDPTPSGLIILVEDDAKLRKLYSDMLRSLGYTVLTASDGEEGLSLLFTNVPRILILDIIMPNMDGIELCRRAREILGPKVPILFLTALDQLEIVQVCLEAGGDDFIVKGSNLSTIADRVRHWSKGGASRRAEKHRSAALAAVRSELSHSSGDGEGSSGLSSDTDEVVAEVSRFLEKARSAAGPDFGKSIDDKLYLLGYTAGLLNYWSVARTHVKPRLDDYIGAVLQETGAYVPAEIRQMLRALDDLMEDESFAGAVSKGTADAVACKAKGMDFVPAALTKFHADPAQKAQFAALHQKVLARRETAAS